LNHREADVALNKNFDSELEAAIVAQEQAVETSRRERPQRSVSDAPRLSSLAVAAGNEYAYVARDVRRIATVGGTLFGVLAVLWVMARPPRRAGTTIAVALAGNVLGLALGLLVCVMRLSSSTALRAIAAAYVSIFRGVPLRVQLLIVLLPPGCRVGSATIRCRRDWAGNLLRSKPVRESSRRLLDRSARAG